MKGLYLAGLVVLILFAWAVAGCDGGGASVNLTQDQGQDQNQRPDNPGFQPTPLDDGCEIRCNRRFDGLIEVIRTCIDGAQSVQILPVLPRDCDSINDVLPITGTHGGGFTGQGTH
jgi:hypothetical protein